MKIRILHERTIGAPPGRVAALIADFGRIWPTQLAPAPRPQGDGRYQAGVMIWEEWDRPGATRAFRVTEPAGIQLEHWFELESAPGATLVRHTVQGRVQGKYEAIWRERIQPGHDVVLEALFDNVEAAAAAEG